MAQFVISFLVLLNPFALFVYLSPIAKELNQHDFLLVLLKAAGLSLAIFLVTTLFGEYIFIKFLFIDFASFKIFGGIVITLYALIFIIQGKKSFFVLKGSLDDLAAEIALPFMVGAATVSLCIIIGNKFRPLQAAGVIIVAMIIHVSLVFLLTFLRYTLFKKSLRVSFDKVLGMLLRLNGFIVGAIGSNLIVSGIKDFFVIPI